MAKVVVDRPEGNYIPESLGHVLNFFMGEQKMPSGISWEHVLLSVMLPQELQIRKSCFGVVVFCVVLVLLVGEVVGGFEEESWDVQVRKALVNISVSPDVSANVDFDVFGPFRFLYFWGVFLTSAVNGGDFFPKGASWLGFNGGFLDSPEGNKEYIGT